MKHDVRWQTAAPLWDLSLADPGAAPPRFRAPAILRFAGDTFMEDLEKQLADDPAGIASAVVRGETWEAPAAGWRAAGASPGPPPKLFHPAHNRFYLVAASLICRLPGLPERTVDSAAEERVAFVLRRLQGGAIDPNVRSSYVELGWFGDRQKGVWAALADRTRVEAGEERLPLFPLAFALEGQRRRLHAGLIPVGGREVYEGQLPPPPASETAGDDLGDPRLERLRDGPLAALQALVGTQMLDAVARAALATALLQLVEFLEAELPVLWSAIDGGDTSGIGNPLRGWLDTELAAGAATGLAVLNELATEPWRQAIRGGTIDAGRLVDEVFLRELTGEQVSTAAASLLDDRALEGQLHDALTERSDARALGFRRALEAVLATLERDAAAIDDAAARERLLLTLLEIADFLQRELPGVWAAIESRSASGLSGASLSLFNLLNSLALSGLSWRELLADADANRKAILLGQIDRRIRLVAARAAKASVVGALGSLVRGQLFARIEAALGPPPAPGAPAPGEETLYVVRCVYERPRCARFEDPVVSDPSAPFRLAGFFDPEAPVREVRIRMPVDTSIAGLSKFPKGVTVMISNELRKQMARVQGLTLSDVEDGNIPPEKPFDLGMVCSLSIPIISICALIILMILVQILNIVFWWLPFFKICLPLNLRSS